MPRRPVDPPPSPRPRPRPGRPPRRRGPVGLWPVTVVLATVLVVLVAMLVLRDGQVDGGIDAAEAESATLTTAVHGAGTAAGTAPAAAGTAERAATRSSAARDDAASPRRASRRSTLRPTVANGLLCRAPADRPALVRRRAGGSSKRIALTFDDGPSTRFTAPVLEILRTQRVPATFFVIGAQARGNPELVRRIVREGHALGNHTWSHANVSAGGGAANSQLMDTQFAIQQAVGRAGCLMRPPEGAVGPGLEAWLREHKKLGVLWDVDSHDYQLPSAASMVQRVVAATRPGSILLFHDGGGDRSRTVAAIPKVIAKLRAKGYEFVTVPELLRLPKAKG